MKRLRKERAIECLQAVGLVCIDKWWKSWHVPPKFKLPYRSLPGYSVHYTESGRYIRKEEEYDALVLACTTVPEDLPLLLLQLKRDDYIIEAAIVEARLSGDLP